jgi:hypothetical protein
MILVLLSWSQVSVTIATSIFASSRNWLRSSVLLVMDLAFVVATIGRRLVSDGQKMGASARISVRLEAGVVVLGVAVVPEQRR